MDMKHRLPISPANWDALKRNVQGLEAAVRGVQRDPTPTSFIMGIIMFFGERDHRDSLLWLGAIGLRPLELHETLFALTHDQNLKNALKGKIFYINGQGTFLGGRYRILEDGNLLKKKKIDPEWCISVEGGHQQLSIAVRSDERTERYGNRFELDALLGGGDFVVDATVGVRRSQRK